MVSGLRLWLFVLLVASCGAERAQAAGDMGHSYTRQEVMIPARDGVLLHAVVLRPVGSERGGEKLPILMQRTPYGVDDFNSASVNKSKPELAASGYVFVYADIRGRYGSGGQFVMNRPIVEHHGKTDVDETTDTRDTIDWLLKNVANNNGRVGCARGVVPGVSGGDGGHRCASGGEGDQPAGADDEYLDWR